MPALWVFPSAPEMKHLLCSAGLLAGGGGVRVARGWGHMEKLTHSILSLECGVKFRAGAAASYPTELALIVTPPMARVSPCGMAQPCFCETELLSNALESPKSEQTPFCLCPDLTASHSFLPAWPPTCDICMHFFNP